MLIARRSWRLAFGIFPVISAMNSSKRITRVISDPRFLLCFMTFALYALLIMIRDCHFCSYFRTPLGVASILLPASLFLWLRHAGYISGIVLSLIAFTLAIFNAMKQREYAIADYGAGSWLQPWFNMSWGYLLVMSLSVVILAYGSVSLWRKDGYVTAL